ncbi:MAG TPA: hypothetical protein VGQ59_11970, partial [Cyclobacteriaceae bacterium]|nr:hypothetical protein [Cyclobacteriaceae bacterium]
MKGNQLKQVWYVTLLVIAFISIIFFTPDFSIFGYQFKKLNLLADIQIEEPLPLAKDSIIKKKDSVVVVAPPAKPGKAFIEEFGSDNLRYFFEALRNS